MSERKKQSEFSQRVRKMRTALGSMIHTLGLLGARIVRLEADLAKLQEDLSTTTIRPPIRVARREGRFEALQRRQAQPGARLLEIHVEGDGARVRLDGETWFGVARRPAMLLLAISDDSAKEVDGFPRWRGYDELAQLLSAQPGHSKLEPASLPGLVHRLRKTLIANDANPFWVETAESRGVRFRQRRREVRYLDRSVQEGAASCHKEAAHLGRID